MIIKKIVEESVEVKNFPKLLEKAFKQSGKSVSQVSREVGISRSYFYSILNDRVSGSLSIENLRSLEQVLDTDFGINL